MNNAPFQLRGPAQTSRPHFKPDRRGEHQGGLGLLFYNLMHAARATSGADMHHHEEQATRNLHTTAPLHMRVRVQPSQPLERHQWSPSTVQPSTPLERPQWSPSTAASRKS